MLLEAIGGSLPMAVGIALSPLPVASLIILLMTPQARTNAPAFLLGWIAGKRKPADGAGCVEGVSRVAQSVDGCNGVWLHAVKGGYWLDGTLSPKLFCTKCC
jgi:hypothetical protein